MKMIIILSSFRFFFCNFHLKGRVGLNTEIFPFSLLYLIELILFSLELEVKKQRSTVQLSVVFKVF